MSTKTVNVLAMAGAVLLFVGLVLQFGKLVYAPYIYLVGAVMFAYTQVVSGYKGSSFVIRRLRRQQLMGALILVLTGVAMLVWHRNEWIVGLTIAAVLELYTAFRIPQEEAKEQKKRVCQNSFFENVNL